MSSFIPVAEAAKMNADYRSIREQMLKPEYQGRNVLPICETFERNQVESLLSKPGCVGLRVYYGMDEIQQVCAVLVAVNEKNEDILPDTNERMSRAGDPEDEDSTLEKGQRCPEECPPPSPLNGG